MIRKVIGIFCLVNVLVNTIFGTENVENLIGEAKDIEISRRETFQSDMERAYKNARDRTPYARNYPEVVESGTLPRLADLERYVENITAKKENKGQNLNYQMPLMTPFMANVHMLSPPAKLTREQINMIDDHFVDIIKITITSATVTVKKTIIEHDLG